MHQQQDRNNEIINMYDQQIYPLNDLISIIKLIIYIPFGLVLFLIRLNLLLIFFILLFVFHKRLSNNSLFIKLLCFILGLTTSIENDKDEQSIQHLNHTVFISNHVTCFDYLSLKSLYSNLNLIENNFNYDYYFIKKPASKNYFFNQILYLNCINEINYNSIKKSDQQQNASLKYPLIIFPEFEATNGKYGLLEFDTEVFESLIRQQKESSDAECVKLVATCLNVNHLFLPFSINYKHSNNLINFIIALFVPATVYKVKFLSSEAVNGDSKQVAQQFQAKIANYLKLKCTNYTINDFNVMLNGKLHSNSDVNDEEHDHEINKLVKQVHDILPDTPVSIIKEYIYNSQTLDIDSIITNLLENKAALEEPSKCVQVEQPKIIQKNTLTTNSSKTTTPVKTKIKPMSYCERKRLLYEEARERYLAKERQKNSGQSE